MERKNNFDFLRLLFASFVVITHSYPLSGEVECDWLCQITNNQLGLSYLGVKGFFILSGYLIFQSFARSTNVYNYYWKRFLRLFPGLIVILVLTCISAIFIYDGSLQDFINNSKFQDYFINNLLLYSPKYTMNGIFLNNPYPSAINGNFWTLSYEFTMYILISLLFFIKNNSIAIKLVVIVSFLLLLTGNVFYFEEMNIYHYGKISAGHLMDLGFYFMSGSAMAAFQIEKIKFKNSILLALTILTTISFSFDVFVDFKYFILPPFVVLFGLMNTPVINNLTVKIGDLSYGIYIFGFPIQQMIQHFFGLNSINLMWTSLIFSIILAYLSWHLIEVKALRLKKLACL